MQTTSIAHNQQHASGISPDMQLFLATSMLDRTYAMPTIPPQQVTKCSMQVAHYLILTHLSEQGEAMPMMDITNMRKRARPEEEDQLVDNPVFKQARMAYDISQEARQRAGCAPICLSCILT